MQILVLNAGSSTLKFRLFAMDRDAKQDRVLASDVLEHMAGESTTRAAEEAIQRCISLGIDALGYRVVHGGPKFTAPARIDARVLEEIRAVSDLAPLHNPIAAAVIEAGMQQLPRCPGVAVFDTAFHSTMPEIASLYALPLEIGREKKLRRYGFHGISYAYVSQKLLECLGRDPAGSGLIICHLGNGASACAVRDGRSVDTSMGLTPLEGLVMGTRSGDVDPGLLLHLMTAEGMTASAIDDLLNHRSGLLGVSGCSSDLREVEAAAAKGDDRAVLALSLSAYRLRKYIGAYAAALGGVDAIAFTAGIGEHSVGTRSRVCAPLAWLGAILDEARNQAAQGPDPARISADASPIAIWVIPTDEERQIARETYDLVNDGGSFGKENGK